MKFSRVSPALFLLFFLSGFAGLVYQIVWIRLAFSSFGVIMPVLSVVVSVFMLGLGLGSWWSGKAVVFWKIRIKRSPLELYALAEFLAGITAVFVPFWFTWGSHRLIESGEINSLTYLVGSATILAAAIFPSCFFMGGTIPIAMGFLEENGDLREGGFSWLYLANVLGAIFGSVMTALVLIEALGFRRTMWVAVLINMGLALCGRSLSRTKISAPPKDPSQEARRPASGSSGPFQQASIMILFVTGFVSMANEILWTRNFTPILGTTIYAFAAILGIYLTATAAGSLFYRWQWTNRQPLFSVDSLLGGAAIAVLFPVLFNDARGPAGLAGVVLGVFPFCAMVGYLTPLLVDRVSRGRPEVAGTAYMVNIMGCVIGPLVASYGLLPWMGVRGSILVLSAPMILLYLFGSLHPSRRRAAGILAVYGVCAGVCAGVSRSYEEHTFLFPGPQTLRRDYVATVISAGEGMQMRLLVNGVGITYLTPLTKTMAHLPALTIAGGPHNALLICFGMGTTFRSLLSWSIPTTAVELVPSVFSAFPDFHAHAQESLNNPLARVVVDDGRRFLMRSAQRFDLITLDPPPPVEAAGSGLLYSKEFYEEVKRHLTPQGLLQQWWPGGERKILAAVARTLQVSFPYVRCYKGVEGRGFHFLAAMHPIKVPLAGDIVRKLPPAAREDLMEWSAGGALEERAKRMVAIEVPMPFLLSIGDGSIITDDFAYNEYYLLRRWLTPPSSIGLPDYVQ